jgi:hypothetical protein
MVLFSAVAFMALSSLIVIKSRFKTIFTSWYFKLSLAVFIILNVFHARHEMKLRYFGWKREAPVYESHFTIRPYLKSIGIKPGDRVISLPDHTNCYTLYLMNQPGNILEEIKPNTKDLIRTLINKGAKYLVINDTSFLESPELKIFLTQKVGQYNEVQIFKIDANAQKDKNYP